MDLGAETAALAAFEGRGAGTDAERRAAQHVRDRLRAAGRLAEVEPASVRPRWALAQAIAAAVAVAGSVISVSAPGLGAALVLLATLSSTLETTGALHVIRRLTGTRASQNVSSRGGDEKRGTLLLVAHVDAPRASTLARWSPRIRDPWLVVGGSMVLVLACCALRLLGFEGNGLTALQLLPTLVLLGATALLVDVELSPIGDGEADAAGAAAVLSLAKQLEGELEYLDVWVVLTGARAPFGDGMRAWLRRHRRELDPKRTVVVAVEALGSGGVRYSRREGTRLLSWRANRDLVRICRDIAADDEDGAAFDAGPISAREPGDAVAALTRGLPAIGIATAQRGAVDPVSVERACDFCAELARRIDMELAPRLAQEPLRPA
jgi:hypothetical protein